jgi:hypothetical protein
MRALILEDWMVSCIRQWKVKRMHYLTTCVPSRLKPGYNLVDGGGDAWAEGPIASAGSRFSAEGIERIERIEDAFLFKKMSEVVMEDFQTQSSTVLPLMMERARQSSESQGL